MSRVKVSSSQFVHTHVHSEYSTFDGLSKLEDLVITARKAGFPALAVTDHGNISSAVKFIQYSEINKTQKGKDIPYPKIKPIIGMETYLSRDHTKKGKEFQPEERKGNRHLVLLARNFQGYQNLCTLSHKAWIDGFYHSPRIDINLLAKHSDGLICSSACLSSVINANLVADRYDAAKKAATIFKDIFGKYFFLEVMFHGLREEKEIIPDIFKLSQELDIPIISTQDAHYIHKEDAMAQEVLMCMSQSTCIKNPKRMHFPYDEFYLKTGEEMSVLWGTTPQVLHNTLALSEMVDSDDIKKNLFGGMRLPPFKVPEGFDSPQSYLEDLAQKGLRRIGLDKSEPHVLALTKEINDIRIVKENNNYDFASYFLTVWDYINWAKQNNIMPGCGRGSGYGSMLLRCLGVTYGVDVIEHGLLWERFLGFEDRQFILEKDFGFEKNFVGSRPKIAIPTNDVIRQTIVKSIKEENINDVNKELDLMENTDSISGVSNLIFLYEIWQQRSQAQHVGVKNVCNCLTAYHLGLTSAKPDGEFLFFRRAYARDGWPDIDNDFDEQEAVYNYIIEKYGREYVANIGTHSTLQLRDYLKRSIKALDVADAWHRGEAAYVTENVAKAEEAIGILPSGQKIVLRDKNGQPVVVKKIQEAYDNSPDFKHFIDQNPDILKYADCLEGLRSHFGVHASGVCISDIPIHLIAPLRRTKDSSTSETKYATQFSLDDLETIGLIKFDILSVITLKIIRRTIEMIKHNYDIDIDIENIPLKDKPTLDLYKTGHLTGIFQCENGGMQETMRAIKVDDIKDVMAAIALYRPGPMDSIPDYCARKNGERPVSYFHKSLEKYVKPYLSDTYGVLVFQEQVMQICNSLCNFSIADGYSMIKAVGKKKLHIMNKFKDKFIAGGVQNSVPREVMEQYWEKFILPFASYGFNRAHSAAYGFNSYLTCYLKANYTAEYVCAQLNVNSEMGGIKKNEKLIPVMQDAKRNFNVKFLPRSLNDCSTYFTIENKPTKDNSIKQIEIRPGLVECKGLGLKAAIHLADKRPYKDLRDLAEKTDPSIMTSKSFEAVVSGGYFLNKPVRGDKEREAVVEKFTQLKDDFKKRSKKGEPPGDIFG